MNQYKKIVQNFRECLAVAPLGIICLLFYLGLKSTVILDGGLHEFNGIYIPAYLGWYDFVLGYAIIFSFVIGSLKFELRDLYAGLVMLFVILASWVGTYQADKTFILAGIVCFLRFFVVFIFAISLVRRLSYFSAESVLIFAYGVLAASAILWYTLQFGEQNRMAASAMTPASFGQVSALMCLIFYGRKYYIPLFFSFIFLFLSFSRTSLFLFIALIVIQNRQFFSWKIIKYALVFLVMGAVGIIIMTKYGGQGSEVVLASRFDPEEISNLNGRSMIWTNAIEQISSGRIPLSGIGFHMSPSLIQENNLKFFRPESDSYYMPPHYHNIIVEYVLTLGIFSTIVFISLLRRIWQTFTNNCTSAFFIFSFFLFSQIIDYTIFPPKEIIIFALMLGLAEGQWRYENRSPGLNHSSEPKLLKNVKNV